jgi:FkbM family methyltransferase
MLKKILNKLGIYKTYQIDIDGRAYRIPIFKGLGFANLNLAEPWMTQLLKEFGSPETTFLDVGANVGQTMLKWKSLFPDAAYTGFEPNKNCITYLNDLIQKNNFVNCELYPYAIDTENSTRKLYRLAKDKSDSTASMIENFRADENRISMEIQTISLKDITPNQFDLIKIDVEGAELNVLSAVFEVCKNAIISCEILPAYSSENAARIERQQAIEKLLTEHDYNIFRVQKSENFRLTPLDEIGIHSSLALSDYVFLPKDKVTQYQHLIA